VLKDQEVFIRIEAEHYVWRTMVAVKHRIKCPRCRNVFVKAEYRGYLKSCTCPYCGYKIDLTKNPHLELERWV